MKKVLKVLGMILGLLLLLVYIIFTEGTWFYGEINWKNLFYLISVWIWFISHYYIDLHQSSRVDSFGLPLWVLKHIHKAIYRTHPHNYLALKWTTTPTHNPLKMRLVFEPLLLRKGTPPCCKLEKRREVEKVD